MFTATLCEEWVGPVPTGRVRKPEPRSGKPSPTEEERAVIQRHFTEAFRRYPAGVSVIAADSSEGPVGLTATSVCSVSLEPAALAFSLSTTSSAAPAIHAASTVVVHLMDGAGQDTAKRFATSGIDRFADASTWSRLPTGEPLLHDAAAWFRGPITDTIDVGSSTVAVVRILEAFARSTGPERQGDAVHGPLVYCDRSWHVLTSGSSQS